MWLEGACTWSRGAALELEVRATYTFEHISRSFWAFPVLGDIYFSDRMLSSTFRAC